MYKPAKEAYQLLPSLNRNMTLKPQSRYLVRKNINNFTATDFKENSRIGGILKADLHTYTFDLYLWSAQ